MTTMSYRSLIALLVDAAMRTQLGARTLAAKAEDSQHKRKTGHHRKDLGTKNHGN
jgi:hypothetical protein